MSVISRIPRLWQYRELLYVLVYRDIKSRTKQALLGYAWVIIQPLLAAGVFTFVIQGLFGLRLTSVSYPLFVTSGVVLWQYFSSSLTASTDSLVTHLDLVTQVYFPREILVLYPCFTKLIDLGISLTVLAALIAIYGGQITWTIVFAPLIVAVQMILTFGLALGLAPLNVAFRDVSRVVPIVLSFAIYAAPVVYPVERVPDKYLGFYFLNPMAVVVHAFRQVVIFGEMPDWSGLAFALLVSLVVLLIGYRSFVLFERLLADII